MLKCVEIIFQFDQTCLETVIFIRPNVLYDDNVCLNISFLISSKSSNLAFEDLLAKAKYVVHEVVSRITYEMLHLNINL